MNEENIPIIPDSPNVLPGEQFYFYVPVATSDSAGIAKFYEEHFNVVKGEVKFKQEYLDEVFAQKNEVLEKSIHNIANINYVPNNTNLFDSIPVNPGTSSNRIVVMAPSDGENLGGIYLKRLNTCNGDVGVVTTGNYEAKGKNYTDAINNSEFYPNGTESVFSIVCRDNAGQAVIEDGTKPFHIVNKRQLDTKVPKQNNTSTAPRIYCDYGTATIAPGKDSWYANGYVILSEGSASKGIQETQYGAVPRYNIVDGTLKANSPDIYSKHSGASGYDSSKVGSIIAPSSKYLVANVDYVTRNCVMKDEDGNVTISGNLHLSGNASYVDTDVMRVDAAINILNAGYMDGEGDDTWQNAGMTIMLNKSSVYGVVYNKSYGLVYGTGAYNAKGQFVLDNDFNIVPRWNGKYDAGKFLQFDSSGSISYTDISVEDIGNISKAVSDIVNIQQQYIGGNGYSTSY